MGAARAAHEARRSAVEADFERLRAALAARKAAALGALDKVRAELESLSE